VRVAFTAAKRILKRNFVVGNVHPCLFWTSHGKQEIRSELPGYCQRGTWYQVLVIAQWDCLQRQWPVRCPGENESALDSTFHMKRK